MVDSAWQRPFWVWEGNYNDNLEIAKKYLKGTVSWSQQWGSGEKQKNLIEASLQLVVSKEE